MKKKDVKKLFKEHPSFEAWIRKEPKRVSDVRINPAEAKRYFREWQSNRGWDMIDLEALSAKTRRASEVLENFRSAIDMMADAQKKRNRLNG